MFYPAGVSDRSDPKFRTCFEDVYDKKRLSMPFHIALGPMEHEGDLTALYGHGMMNLRWGMPAPFYVFEVDQGGERVCLLSMDTTSCIDDKRSPLARRAVTTIAQGLEATTARWKIVFGSQPMYSHGADNDAEASAELRLVMESWLTRFDVDVYVSGGDHSQQLLAAKDGVVHVVAGSGGGPEIARSVHRREDTRFASTGGGFALFRIDGDLLRISFFDVDGNVLHTERITKGD
jgi:tartrate-resistant acid phosphatase type 5